MGLHPIFWGGRILRALSAADHCCHGTRRMLARRHSPLQASRLSWHFRHAGLFIDSVSRPGSRELGGTDFCRFSANKQCNNMHAKLLPAHFRKCPAEWLSSWRPSHIQALGKSSHRPEMGDATTLLASTLVSTYMSICPQRRSVPSKTCGFTKQIPGRDSAKSPCCIQQFLGSSLFRPWVKS